MRSWPGTLFTLLLSSASLLTAQSNSTPWAPILNADRAIDWSTAGVGSIPARPTHCATLHAPSSAGEINAALRSCAPGQAVYLEAGSYDLNAPLSIPSEVTLRGAGADHTRLRATGRGNAVVQLGSGGQGYSPISILRGATAHSIGLTLRSAQGLSIGSHLVITEINRPGLVTSSGSEGNCNWCDGGWSRNGQFARGQIVEITALLGDRVTITPALYSDYSLEPMAVPVHLDTHRAGVEDLAITATNSGYGANFALSSCAYCWVKGVASEYPDGDHISVTWGFHDEIRDSYFSNAWRHLPGQHDSDLQLALKTTATLVENNIIERTHVSVMLEWGAAGNVVAYNYTTGEFDSGSPNVVIGGIDFHGAHPQFNLLEGNLTTNLYEDSIWGSSSHTTSFRNWIVGTNRICQPLEGNGRPLCAGGAAHQGFQSARAMQISYLATHDNFIANLIGSKQMQSLIGYHLLTTQAVVDYPALRSYDGIAYLWSFGYGATNDDGTGTGCTGGIAPCHRANSFATHLFHGNVNNVTSPTVWIPNRTHTLPASFYRNSKPLWWGSLPWPAIGPDVTGGSGPGNHSFGNPAQRCYLQTMGGQDGGPRSPLAFNAQLCYGSR